MGAAATVSIPPYFWHTFSSYYHPTSVNSFTRFGFRFIPEDVIYCVVLPCLHTSDQLHFLSTCKAFLPLLIRTRRMRLSDATRFTKDWKRIVQILGLHHHPALPCNNNDDPYYSRRKLSIVVNFREKSGWLDKQVLNHLRNCIHFVHALHIKGSPIFGLYLSHYSVRSNREGLILNPTISMIPTWHRFRMEWSKLHYLSVSVNEHNELTEPPSFVNGARRSLSELRGVRCIRLDENDVCILELCYGCCLETVVLAACNEISDISLLLGVKHIVLCGYGAINYVDALSQSEVVELYGCAKIDNVAALSNVKEVYLQHMQLNDLTPLGTVTKLHIWDCAVQTFPVPSGQNQEWSLSDRSITTLIGFENIQSLELVSCLQLRDITMLGNVQYLSIYQCCFDEFPTPTGTSKQEWAFVNTFLPGDTDVLKGLHKLTISHCSKLQYISSRRNIGNFVIEKQHSHKEINLQPNDDNDDDNDYLDYLEHGWDNYFN